jgi:hypothetical protein
MLLCRVLGGALLSSSGVFIWAGIFTYFLPVEPRGMMVREVAWKFFFFFWKIEYIWYSERCPRRVREKEVLYGTIFIEIGLWVSQLSAFEVQCISRPVCRARVYIHHF